MSLWNVAALCGHLGCMACFSWAMRNFFVRKDTVLALEQKLVVYLGALFGLTQALALAISPVGAGFPIACVLWVVSLLLFWSAIAANRARRLTWAFEKDEPVHLVSTGPYRWIRHPFYLSYSLCWLAAPTATSQPWLLLPFFVMGVLYWRSAQEEEKKFLLSSLSAHYQSYRSRTGMFWPAFW